MPFNEGNTMNKLLKGSIAGAAGIALLLGGAGTFALWNQTAVVAGGSVTSGVLTIANSGNASWKDISADKTASTIDISTFKIVPGDKIELTQVVNVKATGDNLKANLAYDATTITTAGADAAAVALNQALKDKLVVTMAATGTGVTAGALANEFVVAPSATQTAVTVKITIELPTATGTPAGTGTIAQAGSVNLTGLAFKLTQVR
jgi:alternate signal-mediated exported protein